MGGRKDMRNKRQLSIIDETDYFIEEGHLQGQVRTQCHKWLGKVDNSNFIIHTQLNGSHSPLPTKWGQEKTGENVFRENCTSVFENYRACCHSDTFINDVSATSQDDLSFKGKLILSSSTKTAERDNKNIVNTNRCTNMTFECDARLLDTQMYDKFDNSMESSLGDNHVSDLNGNFQTENFHASTSLHHGLDTERDLEMKHKTNEVPTKDQNSNIDSIHEMFQVLIKCIDGKQGERQTPTLDAESENACRGSPLIYLMDERVEKQPQAVNNIISAFKEKLSLPNAKRPPVRQKSNRTLLVEKMSERLEMEGNAKHFNPSLDLYYSERNHCVGFKGQHKKDFTIDDRTTFLDRTCLGESHEDISNSIDGDGEDTDAKGNVKKYNFQELEVIKESEDQYLGVVQVHTQDTDEHQSEEIINTNVSHSSIHDIATFTVHAPESFVTEGEDEKCVTKEHNQTILVVFNEKDSHSKDHEMLTASRNTTLIQIGNTNIGLDRPPLCHGDELRRVKETKEVDPGDLSPELNVYDIQEVKEETPYVGGFLIPTFRREGPKVYEEDETDGCWNYLPSESGDSSKKFSYKAKTTTNFLTVPNAHPVQPQNLQIDPFHNQVQKQTVTISTTPGSIRPASETSPTSPQSKSITFLNSNGSIARKPMLRHVSQPNMNAHTTPQFPNLQSSSCSSHEGDSQGTVESKFQTKDLNSDLAKLKATAVRLNLTTRRPSYMEWLEERRKHRLSLGILEYKQEDESVITSSTDTTSSLEDTLSAGNGDIKLERIIGQCQQFGLISSKTTHKRLLGGCENDIERCDGSKFERSSSRRSNAESTFSASSNDSIGNNTDSCDGGDNDNDNYGDDGEEFNRYITVQSRYCGKAFDLIRGRREPTPQDRLTDARKERIDKSLAWLRNELKTMRNQDQALARQLLSLRHEMHKLRLSWSCQEHRDLLDEVQCDLEDFQEFSKVLDLPSTVHLDTPLKNVGVTRLNISARRFSTC